MDRSATPIRSSTTRPPYNGKEINLVISIDLGTTFSGTSWVLLEPGVVPDIHDVSAFEGQEHAQVSKVPTVLYYDNKGKLQAAGGETSDTNIIARALEMKWTRVEWFKLLLRPPHLNDTLDRAPESNMPHNKKLVTVIADFLRYMANMALVNFREGMDPDGSTWNEVKNRAIYILSHPNGWNTFQHVTMREAAILAGLVPRSDEGENRIIFVSEGEASLHWCMNRGFGRRDLKVGSEFIVVDAGGGTIDISSFKTVDTLPLKFEESSVPECYLQGSVFVTNAFRSFVQDKLKGSSFGDPDTIERVVEIFDQQVKRNFRDRHQDVFIRFGRTQDSDPKFGITAGQLRIVGEEMAQFYEPACRAIVASLKAKIPKINTDNKTTVVLVGGYGGNQYLYKEVQRGVSEIAVTRPNDATAKASANGVICFYLDHNVSARMAKWTYGISCVHDFNPKDDKHLRRKSRVRTDPVSGQQYLEGGFFVTLKKGTVVEETTLTRFPFWHSQTERKPTTLNLVLECYRGDVLDIKFRDEDTAAQFKELCWFKAAIPETSLVRRKGKNLKRAKESGKSPKYYYVSNFDVVVSFGATEFKCHIEWRDEKGKSHCGPITPIWRDG